MQPTQFEYRAMQGAGYERRSPVRVQRLSLR